MEIGLSFGSNQGDRLRLLSEGRAAVARIPGVSPLAKSPVYETDPVDVAAGHENLKFLNAVAIVAYDGAIHGLVAAIRAIESAAGRRRSVVRNAPRTLDIDVIYADALVMNEPEITLPHPRWSSRRFVVQPLADVRPDLVVPGGEPRPVREVLLTLPPVPNVVLFAHEW